MYSGRALLTRIPLFSLLGLLLMLRVSAHPAFGQTVQSWSKTSTQPRPVSLPHLYWHFLVYQNILDNRADELEAQGKDESWLHRDLQTRMGFSDADFAPIRSSSVRLSSELKTLNSQFAAIRAAGPSASNTAQLQTLIAQREAYVNAEISGLKQTLSPERIATFESFITQFFAPKPLTIQITPTSAQATPAAVQP